MMRNVVAALLLLFWIAPMGRAQGAPDSVEEPPPGSFPAGLLEGMPDFALALQFFADSRGNFGPCG